MNWVVGASTSYLGSLACRERGADDRLNSLNLVDSWRAIAGFSVDCFKGSKSFLLKGRALNAPLFLISCRILSSVDIGS